MIKKYFWNIKSKYDSGLSCEKKSDSKLHFYEKYNWDQMRSYVFKPLKLPAPIIVSSTVNSRYLEVLGTIFFKFKLPEVQTNVHFG